MLTAWVDRLAIMFGGTDNDKVFNDMWYYNVFTNMWQQISLKTEAPFVIPPPLKEFSMVMSRSGILLYGGQTW